MKNLKTVLSLILALALMLCMAACQPSQPQTPSGTGDQGPEQTDPQQTDPSKDTFLESLKGLEGLPETLANGNINIVYWYNPDQYAYDISKNPDVYDPILAAIPYFEEKYGGKVTITYAPWGEMLQTVTSMQNGKDAPDLFEVYDSTMYSVILSKVCQPLDDYTTDLYYSYYDVDKSLFSWKGSVYAIPLKPYVRTIMFNRDIFELEGLDTPDKLFTEGKWNWSTFREVCNTLTIESNGTTLQSGYGGWQESFLYFLYANGTTMLDMDTATGTVKPNLKNEKAINAINYLVELRKTLNFQNALDYFDEGIEAMVCGKEIADTVTLPFEVGMVPFPSGDDYEGKNVVVYPQGMAVPTGAKNPEGAVAFMRIVSELQRAVGDQKEANRIGQECYDLIYADDVKFVYAYDKCLPNADHLIATITNYIIDGVPANTIVDNVMPELEAQIKTMYEK